MKLIHREDGQALQIGDITVTVLEVGEDEVLFRIDGVDESAIALCDSSPAARSAGKFE
jgi:sRNA-binding carbon storage regulator CsrA